MMRWLIKRMIGLFERRYDYDMTYAKSIVDASHGASWRFVLFCQLTQFRETVPVAPYFAAKIVATLREDCGPCTQLLIAMATEAGVSAATLRAIVAADYATLDHETALALRFAHAVLSDDANGDALRDQVVARWGEAGLTTLALAIANTRAFPTMKRVLGYAKACSRLEVAGEWTQPAADLFGPMRT